VRLQRLERLAVHGGDSLCGFAARRAAVPELRVMELQRCCCGNSDCPVVDCKVVGCILPQTVELLEELRAAWPGLELRRWREDDWAQV
jgi:hypothetical protein